MSDVPKKSIWQPGMRTIHLTDTRRPSKVQSAPTSPQTASKSSPPAIISDSFWARLDEDAVKMQAADLARKNPKDAGSPAAPPPLPPFDPNAPRGGFGTGETLNRFDAAMQHSGDTGSAAEAGGPRERTARQENYELRKELARSEKQVELLERENELLREELEYERKYSSYRNPAALIDPALEVEWQEKERQIAYIRERYKQDMKRIERQRPSPFTPPRRSPFDLPFTGVAHEHPELDPIFQGGALFARPPFSARDHSRRRYDHEAELGW